MWYLQTVLIIFSDDLHNLQPTLSYKQILLDMMSFLFLFQQKIDAKSLTWVFHRQTAPPTIDPCPETCIWVKIPEIYQELTTPSDFVPTFRIPSASRGHKMMIWVEKKISKIFIGLFWQFPKNFFFVCSKYVNLLFCITHPIFNQFWNF